MIQNEMCKSRAVQNLRLFESCSCEFMQIYVDLRCKNYLND